MADFTHNVAKGRVRQYFENVEANSPTGSCITVVAINANGATDAAMKDAATLSALLATAVNEVTNTNYARIEYLAASITITQDDTNERVDLDITDPSWNPGPAAGDAWTDLVFCYDPTGSSADTAIIPLMNFDFAITPDGSIVTAQVNASGLLRIANP